MTAGKPSLIGRPTGQLFNVLTFPIFNVRTEQLASRIRPMRPPSTRRRAFTLIELLVVIAIIAILVGLAVPSLFSIYERARKTQAKNDLTQIVNAVNAFYTDYGKYPIATSGADVTFPSGGTTNEVLFKELRACQTGQPSCLNAASLNTRQIVYLSPRVLGTAPVRSAIASNDGQFYDPWQTPYNVTIDGDYNNQITTNPYGNNTGAGPMPLPQGVIGWSPGKDHTLGLGGAFTGSDDVISWQ
jgi:prepilin-type N-terminal cleavage/methylation domain-containing protein